MKKHTNTKTRRGRPRLSVTDIRSTHLLREAIKNDHALLRTLCKRLADAEQFLANALHITTDTDGWAIRKGDTEAVRHRFILNALVGGSVSAINAVRNEVTSLIEQRAKRSDAGAPLPVLAIARAKSIAVRTRKAKKGGAL